MRTAFGLGLFLLTPALAHAHALGAEAELRDNQVVLEAYYDDDTPAVGATVQAFDSAQTLVAEGTTNERGVWSMPAPGAGRYTLIVDSGDGHRTRVRLTIPEATGSSPAISDGPSREEFTRFPWLNVGVGFALIGGVGLFCWLALRSRTATHHHTLPDEVGEEGAGHRHGPRQ